jgi:TolA-binding protein
LSQDTKQVYQAERHIGEILFSKVEDYKAAIDQYQRLLGKYPDSEEKDFFLYRMAKSYYHILKFDDSVATFRRLINERPQSHLLEESLYQIGNGLYTKGEYEAAIEAFEEVMIKFPKGKYTIFAQFGVATCYEELDQLDEAYTIYNRIKDSYPSKNVVELKLKRVKERRESRNR